MKNCISDPALFYKPLKEGPIDLSTTGVDDDLYAGSENLQETSKKAEIIFKCKKREHDNVLFSEL